MNTTCNRPKSLNNQNYSDRLIAFLNRNVLSCFLKMARLLLVLIVDYGSENEQRGEQRRLCSRARAGGGAGEPAPPPPPHFLKKKRKEKKYIFSTKRNL